MYTENQKRNSNRRPVLLILLLSLIALLVVLARCINQRLDLEFPDPAEGDCSNCILQDEREAELPEIELDETLTYVPNQLILTGLGSDLELVVQEVNNRGVPLELVIDETLEYLPRDDSQQQQLDTSATDITAALSATQFNRLPDVQLNLYRLDPESGVELGEAFSVLAATIRELNSGQLQGHVFADLNYVTRFWVTGAPWGIDGAPWGIDGAPWGIDGARWGINGKPITDPNVQIAADTYWRQWTFGSEQGVGLMDSDGETRTIRATGRGVRVVVLDTSPFSEPAQYSLTDWMAPPALSIAVSHPVTLPTSDATYDLSDHGLFVAGLIYAVAPESEIHLLRVLNDQGKGDLHSLLRGLNSAIEKRLTETGSLQNTVFNFSLTIKPDAAEGVEPLPPEAIAAIKALAEIAGYAPGTFPVPALDVPMEIIRQQGGVVVAAGGNNSYDDPPSQPEPAGLPAAYPQVIGVEAGNQAGERSCYSNQAAVGNGDLRAPGGDGGPPANESTPTPDGETANCMPRHYTCDTSSADCAYGVISMTLNAHKGFAYWVGSSFATPLVSGLAALELQSGTPPGDIAADVALQNGIINIPGSLE